MPELQQFYEEFGARVHLVGVDIGQFTGLGSPKDVGSLLQALGITYPAGFTDDGTVVGDYGVWAMPTTVFINGDGRVFRIWTGALDLSQATRVTNAMLGEEPGPSSDAALIVSQNPSPTGRTHPSQPAHRGGTRHAVQVAVTPARTPAPVAPAATQQRRVHAAAPASEDGPVVARLRAEGPDHAARLSMSLSNTVLPTVDLGPPNWAKSRIFVLRFRLVI